MTPQSPIVAIGLVGGQTDLCLGFFQGLTIGKDMRHETFNFYLMYIMPNPMSIVESYCKFTKSVLPPSQPGERDASSSNFDYFLNS